jgi:hypothetical protein
MRRVIVVLLLCVIGAGLLLAVFGASEITTITGSACTGSAPLLHCTLTGYSVPDPKAPGLMLFYLQTTSHADFILNYIGVSMALMGTIALAFALPRSRPSKNPRPVVALITA